jgi:hypothetical protein
LRFIARAIDLASDVLPTPGGPEKVRIVAFGFLTRRADGEELEDALLDLLEPVVILVEDLLGALQVAALAVFLCHGHRDQPVEVVARDGRLGDIGGIASRRFSSWIGLLLDVLRHLGLFDLLLQLVDLVALLVLAAQFLLDRLHLLVEVVLLLRLLHLLLDARLDAAIDLELVDLDFEDAGDAVQALDRRDDFEQVLLLVDADEQVRGESCRRACPGSSTRTAAIIAS